MLSEVRAAGLPVAYLVMDAHYTAGFLNSLAGHLGSCWVGTLPRGPQTADWTVGFQPPPGATWCRALPESAAGDSFHGLFAPRVIGHASWFVVGGPNGRLSTGREVLRWVIPAMR
jgi:hypothetical protein